MPIVTISRQMGSLGDDIAHALAQSLQWDLLDRSQLIDRFLADQIDAHERHLLSESAKQFLSPSPTGESYLDRLQRGLFQLASRQSLVLLGFGSQILFADNPTAIHVRITAPFETRLQRVGDQYRVSPDQAARILETADRRHRRFVSTVFDADCADETLYHLMLNTGFLSVEDTVQTILSLIQLRERTANGPGEPYGPDGRLVYPTSIAPAISSSGVKFKNASEAEFARILDMHAIAWTYEPKTFPVEWDAEGNVTLAFSPDFYLTQFDTYIELTTMNQRYVTEKNKKMRRVRELYPGTHIKIVYKKDFHALVERFSAFGGGGQSG